jgi:hypothetical protein
MNETMNRHIIAKLVTLAVVMQVEGCSTPAINKSLVGKPASGPINPAADRYDKKFVQAVELHWYDLLDRANREPPKGEVVLKFRLHEDGEISDMAIISNTVGDKWWATLCENAVQDPAPYQRWPQEMHKQFPRLYREIKFTFNYDSEPDASKSK